MFTTNRHRKGITEQDRREYHIHIVLNNREMKLLNELRKETGINYATLFRSLMLKECREKNLVIS